MVEFCGGEDGKAGTESAAFGIVGGVYEAGDTRLNHGAGTHGAGLQRNVKGGIGQSVIAYELRSFANDDNLRVSRGIIIADRTIAGARKNGFILDEECANGNFAGFCRGLGFG